MLKRLVRYGIRRTKDWLHEEQEPTGWPFHHAYGQLNRIFEDLMKDGSHMRPHFVWGVVYGAYLAKTLGIKRISVMEFGVAGGNGLLNLEHVALGVERHLGVEIDVYGFDTGVGLPKPDDYRDLPNLYREGAFAMDFDGLRGRLKKAKLILGLVENTVPEFIRSAPAPIAFISFDMDYYSATMHAFKLFDADHSMLLPRVHCYFDDIIGLTYSEFNGEKLAINEFNNSHPMAKISPIGGLRHCVTPSRREECWIEMMYMAHVFDHKLYNQYDGLINPGDKSAVLASKARLLAITTSLASLV